MLSRGNNPAVFELEKNLRRWIAATTTDRVTAKSNRHEDLAKSSEILLLNFLQDLPITNEQQQKVDDERKLGCERLLTNRKLE